jgi:hypothetical protein
MICATDAFWSDDCWIEGLESELDDSIPQVRSGTVLVTSIEGRTCKINVSAEHPCSISNGRYTLVGSGSHDYWIVGKTEKLGGRIKKVSVLTLHDSLDEGRRHLRLEFFQRSDR